MTIAEEINRACDEVEKFDEACRIARQQAEAVNELCTWIDELKAYRDTGVTPEEIAEVQAAIDPIPFERFHDILEAECGGRLVVLPCRVTDTVYITEAVFENGKQKKRNKPCGERVVSAQIDHVTIGGTTGKPVFDLCTDTGNWYYSMDPEQFYLTRDAAEAALKGRER